MLSRKGLSLQRARPPSALGKGKLRRLRQDYRFKALPEQFNKSKASLGQFLRSYLKNKKAGGCTSEAEPLHWCMMA